MKDDFEKDLGKPEIEKKVIVEMPEDTSGIPWWQLWLANLINSSGVVIFLIVSYFLLDKQGDNAQLVLLRDAALNLVVPSVLYGVGALVFGLTAVSWLFPYFSYRKQVQNGTSSDRLGCMIFWGCVVIGLSIIIASAIK